MSSESQYSRNNNHQRAAIQAIRIPLRWRDLDYQGHVYHAEFLTIADEARTKWLAEELQLENAHQYVIVSLKIDYISELTSEHEAVDASIAIEQLGTSSITTREELRSPVGQLLAQITCVLIPWDADTREKRALSRTQRMYAEAHLISEMYGAGGLQ